MVRISDNKIEIKRSQNIEDMGKFFSSRYYVPEWYLCSLDTWSKILAFQDFDPLTEMYKPHEKFACFSQRKRRFDYLMEISGGFSVWELNIMNKELNGYIRIIVCIGEKKFNIVSWVDAYIKYPIYKRIVSVLNFGLKIRKKFIAKGE